MEVNVRNGNPLRGVGDVEQTVEVVLACAEVTGEVDVVDPDIGRLVDADGVAVVGVDLADG